MECAILLQAVSDLCAGFSLRSSWQQVRFESYEAHSAERNKTRGYIHGRKCASSAVWRRLPDSLGKLDRFESCRAHFCLALRARNWRRRGRCLASTHGCTHTGTSGRGRRCTPDRLAPARWWLHRRRALGDRTRRWQQLFCEDCYGADHARHDPGRDDVQSSVPGAFRAAADRVGG